MRLPRPFRHLTLCAASIAITLLSACGGGGGGGSSGIGGGAGGGAGGGTTACSETARKQFVLDATREWYLFPELLPVAVDIANYAKAEDVLNALTATAREQRKDRYFSYLTTRTVENALFGEGQFSGFGIRIRTETGNRPFIIDVFESSPAMEASMRRGDEIVAVDQGAGYVDVATLLANGSTISDALGPSDVGVQRGLRLLRGAATVEVMLTKRTVTIDPVPDTFGVRILPLAGTTGVGYVHLRSYVSTADPQLRDAFAQFRSAGLQYFIVDLRYNGGGLVSTSTLINDLLGGARRSLDVQSHTVYNTAKSSRNSTTIFAPRAESVQPVRVAFLTTEVTASASEINVNSMKPWVEVAIVGGDTLGKPVGQLAFDLSGCDDRLRLISFKTTNSRGEGDFYDGLASTMQFACAATDTLDTPMGDPADSLTNAALHWLGTGACSTVMAGTTAGMAKPGRELDRFPPPRRPSAAQFWVPGVN
jgi:C-terminal processing protease CtpA/Prc